MLAKRFRPIALTSAALKLTEKAILSRLKLYLCIPPDPLQFAYKPNRSTLDAVSFLIHRITKSLNESSKSVRCIFLDYSSAFDSVPRSRLLLKLESFGCPKQLIAWLANYFTNRMQSTKLGKVMSQPLTSNSGVLQGAVLSPFLFSAYISDLDVMSPACVVKYADDVVLCQPVSNLADFNAFGDNLSQIQRFSSSSGLTLNEAKCLECVFSFSHSSFPDEHVFINSNSLPRVTSVKYLGVTIDNNLRWSSHVQICTGKLRRLSFQIRKLRQFRTPQHIISLFVYQCIFPVLLYCSPVIFPGLLKQDFKVIRRALLIISRVSAIPIDELVCKLVDLHIDSCVKFAQKILADVSHPLHVELSSCRSHSITRSEFRLIPSRINVYRNSPVPYLARVLTNESKMVTELRSSLGV